MRAILITVLACTGCAELQQMERDRIAQERADYRRYLQDQCTSYGFTSGTTEFANCMIQADQAEKSALEQRKSIVLDNYLRTH